MRAGADDVVLLATSRRQSLLISYLEAYLSRLEHWLREWRIGICVSKSTAVLFANIARRIQKLQPVCFFGKPMQWVKTTQYLGGDP
jgi:hypothetical protein